LVEPYQLGKLEPIETKPMPEATNRQHRLAEAAPISVAEVVDDDPEQEQ